MSRIWKTDGASAAADVSTLIESRRTHAQEDEIFIADSPWKAEWTEHIGKHRMDRLRKTLSALREITDPYR